MIKQFDPSKLDRVMNIWLDTNIESHPFVPKAFWEDNYEGVKAALFDAEIMIYEEEAVQGFIGIIAGSYIAGLFVAKQFQGRGIGKKLIEECKVRYSSLSLDVYVKNTSAVQFYKNCGFEIGQTKQNEDTREAEYTMKWEA